MTWNGFYTGSARERCQMFSVSEEGAKGSKVGILRYIGTDPQRVAFTIDKLRVGR